MTNFLQTKDNARGRIPVDALKNTTSPITISNFDTSLFPAVTTGYVVTIWDDVNYMDPGDDPNMEKALVTAATINISGSFTITRNNPKSHTGGPKVALLAVSQHVSDLTGAVSALENTRAIDLPEISLATAGQLTIGYSTIGTATGTYTAPALASTVSQPYPSFGLVNMSGSNVIIQYPNPVGTVINTTVLIGEIITFRQTTLLGYRNISSGKPLGQLDARYQANGAAIPESQVTGLVSDLAAKAPVASPALTGTPTAPTATAGTNSTQIATTAYADTSAASAVTNDTIHALKSGDTFTGPVAFTNSGLNETAIVAGTTKGIFAGVVAGDTARLIFTTGTANQAWEIDNSNGTFRWYKSGTTYLSMDTSNVTFNTNIIPSTTTSRQIGTNSLYWTSVYANNLYFNSSASFTTTGSTIAVTGKLKGRITGTTLDTASAFQIDRATNSTDAQGLYFSNGLSVDYYIGRLANSDDLVFGTNGGGGFGERLRFTTGGDVYSVNSGKNLGNSTYYWGNLYATRHYLNATAYIDGATSGAAVLSGKLGIGNSNPTYNLDVSGTMRVAAGDILQTGNNVIKNVDNPLYLQTDVAADVIFRTSGSNERMRVTDAGVLRPPTNNTGGIGQSTYYFGTAYITRHYVNGTAYIDGASAGVLTVGANNFQVTSSTGARYGRSTNISDETVIFARTNGEGDPTLSGGTVAVFQNNATSGYTGYIQFIAGSTATFGLNFGHATNNTLGSISFNNSNASFSISQTLYARNLLPNTNATFSLGTSAAYWSNSYVTRQYLNATAYLDGATAGQIAASGQMIFTSSSRYSIDAGATNISFTNGANTIEYGRIRTEASTFGILSLGRDLSLATTSGSLIFKAGTGTETEYMRLSSAGLLGLGITGPGAGLEVYGGGSRFRSIGTVNSASVSNVGTTGSTTYSYYVVAIDRSGRRTTPSGVTTTTTGNATLSATNYNTISWSALTGAVSYEILKTDTLTLLGATTTTSFSDTGQTTSTYTNRQYSNQTGEVSIDGQLSLGTKYITAPKMVITDADSTLVLTNNGEAPFGFLLQSYTATQLGLWNITSTTQGVIPAYTKRSMFGFDATGKVGTMTNSSGSSANNQTTTGAPAYRTVIDDGAGMAYFQGSLTASSSFQNAFAISPTVNQSGTASYNALYINVTETATGSGNKRIIDTNVGGSSRFYVDNGGNVNAASVISSNATRVNITNRTATATLTPGTSSETNTVDATAAAITLTLAATTTAGYRFTIKRTDNTTANAVSIAAASGTIDGQATISLASQYKYVTVVSTSTSGVWLIMGNN